MHSPPSSSDSATPFAFEELARVLTAASDDVVVWKGGASVAAGGDLDMAVPREAYESVVEAFRAWAFGAGVSATVVCEHGAGTRVVVACGGSAGERLLQLDLVDRKLVHGAPVWTARQLRASAQTVDGIRRLPPGAEGIARVLARPGDTEGHALVRRDPASARRLASVLGLAGRAARTNGVLARARLELVLAARAVTMPRSVARALLSDRARRRCRVLSALASGRRLDRPVDRWLDEVTTGHEVRRA